MSGSDTDSAEFEEQNERDLREQHENSEQGSDSIFGRIRDSMLEEYEYADEISNDGRSRVIVDAKFVAKMLERDAVCRMHRKFPLIDFHVVSNMHRKYCYELDEDLMCEMPKPDDNYEELPSFYQALDELTGIFRLLDDFFTLGEGHLVLAGGALTYACCRGFRCSTPKDADLFFYGISIEDAEKIVQKIIAWWLKFNELENSSTYHVYRNGHVTTFWHSFGDREIYENRGTTYQVIHRCYASIDEVIGGFDLSPCAIVSDGYSIWMTEMGAFALMSGFMIIDVSRRSRSFSERILKYLRKGFNPVFCALSHQEILQKYPECKDKGKQFVLGERVRIYVTENRLTFLTRTRKGYTGNDEGDYDSGQDFNTFNVQHANTLMAAQGKEEMIVWEVHSSAEKEISIPRLENRLNPEVDPNWQDLDFPMNTLTPYYWCNQFDDMSESGQICALYRWFGSKFVEWRKQNKGLEFVDMDRLAELSERVEASFRKAEATKGQLRWLGMNDNPTRQGPYSSDSSLKKRHTSSIHPIDETISFYNPDLRKPLFIGIRHEIWLEIAKARRDENCGLSWLPYDVFKMIMQMLRESMAVTPLNFDR